MDLQAILFILLLGSLFGAATVSSRFCDGQFDPVTYSGLRISLAAAGYALFYLLTWLLQEAITPGMMLAMLLILAGMVIINYRRRRSSVGAVHSLSEET